MHDRKQHVIHTAHQLFIEKGFQSTSLQDILEASGISKGTFYNYFSSKNELLIAIFKSIFLKMEKQREDLLTNSDRTDPEVFIKQIDLQMRTNRENNLIPLFEEVLFSNDHELKQFLEDGQMKTLQWIAGRLEDLFNESKHPYLLDAALMLKGILQQYVRHFAKAYGPSADLLPVIRYSVRRVMNMIEDVSKKEVPLFPLETLEKWLPSRQAEELQFRKQVQSAVVELKKCTAAHCDDFEKLAFIQEELIHSNKPRKFLIESLLFSMKSFPENEIAKIRMLAESKY